MGFITVYRLFDMLGIKIKKTGVRIHAENG